jgi:CheY-like chemotaxis protein
MANILIVDDERAIRAILSQLLRADGHTVQAAADGLEALKACRVLQFDVLFCDLFMPGMEGLETIRTIRTEFPRLKVVAMSGGGRSGLDLLHVARMMGAAAILEKPFKWEQVKQAMEKALRPAESEAPTAGSSYATRPALA